MVGDTPETVELNGVRNLLEAVRDKLGAREGKTLYAAAGPGGRPVNQELWGDLSDPVMGGVSESSFILDSTGGEGGGPTGLFRGSVSTANNGGFCSVRTRNFREPADASGYDAVALRVRGDGQRYKLFVRTDPGWDAMAFACSFDTEPGRWQTVVLPFSGFRAIFRARTVRGAPPLDASRVHSLQLMLSKFEYDGELNPNFKGGFCTAVLLCFMAGSAPRPSLARSRRATKRNECSRVRPQATGASRCPWNGSGRSGRRRPRRQSGCTSPRRGSPARTGPGST